MSGFNHRILVVDDEAAVRETAKTVLATQGYEIITAVDGFDGLVQLRRSLPDIIITDLFRGMPILRVKYSILRVLDTSRAVQMSRWP